MRLPKGLGFDIACGLVVTVVLDDFVSLTGTFLGEVQEKHHHHRKCDDLREFILIQLTSPLCRMKDQKIPEGTFCAINVDKIQFIFPGVKCPEKKHEEWDDQESKYGDDKCSDGCDNKCDEDKDEDKWDNDKW